MAGARVRISLVAAARLVRLVQSRGAGLSWPNDPLRCISLTRPPPVSLRRVVYLQCSPDYKRLEGSGVVHLSGPSFFPAACPRRMGRR